MQKWRGTDQGGCRGDGSGGGGEGKEGTLCWFSDPLPRRLPADAVC